MIWRKYKISSLGKVITGNTPPSKFPEHFGEHFPFITPTDFSSYIKTAYSAKRYISEIGAKSQANKILPINSVLVTCIGSDMGKVIINKIPCLTNQQINSINPDTNVIDYNFLYYALCNNYELLRSLASDGTTMPIVNKTDFENIEIIVPEDIKEQKRIASILSSIDDKIELNRRMNQTLEQIASTLFNKYFVDDIDPDNLPEGWRPGKLAELLTFRNGKSSPIRKQHAEFAVYGSNGIIGFCEVCNAKAKSIIIGRVGSFCGSLYLALNRSYVTDNAIIAEAKIDASIIYNYLLLQSLNLNSFRGGSGQPLVNQNVLGSIDVLIPPTENIHEYDRIALTFYEQIFHNDEENKSLEKIRDTLLPKLMAGELEITTHYQNEPLHEAVLS